MAENMFLDKVRHVLFENKVVILFLIVTAFAFYFSGMSSVVFMSELFTRFGRNTFLVLSLLIPVVAGIGLNFGIVIGAMAAQLAVFLGVIWGVSGVGGIFTIALIATPIAIVLGYMLGKLFNNMKGSEMIGGLIVSPFMEGFYQFLFLFVFGGVITIANERVMAPITGVGVVNAIDIGASPNYMRQALDDVSMLNILIFGFFAVLIFTACLVLFKIVKKQPLTLFGKTGLIKHLVLLGILGLGYGLIWFVEPFLHFLYQNRLNGVYASRLAALGFGAYFAFKLARERQASKDLPVKYVALLVLILVGFLITLLPGVAIGLASVGIPVFTYLLICMLCLFIKWFLTTRLGQNMRTVGHDRAVATSAGINVDRTRIIAMIMSTVLAAWGHIILLQSFGVMATYDSHRQIGLYAIAALLVGGATVTRASVKHAVIGVLLFHALFILAPFAGAALMGQALIGEYFRLFVANAVIALALIMHAWQRVKKSREDKAKQPLTPAADKATA